VDVNEAAMPSHYILSSPVLPMSDVKLRLNERPRCASVSVTSLAMRLAVAPRRQCHTYR
jgi:hypothetical protein